MDYTQLIGAVIALISAIITTFVVPYLKAKIGTEKMLQLVELIKIAVVAAEQIYVGSGRGFEKKNYVLDFLAQHGIDVNNEEINARIEAEVYKLNAEIVNE